jgi:hypothetical protein
MFGKINIALGISSKQQSNQISPYTNRDNNQQAPNNQITPSHFKPLLSNPTFYQKVSKPSSKQ